MWILRKTFSQGLWMEHFWQSARSFNHLQIIDLNFPSIHFEIVPINPSRESCYNCFNSNSCQPLFRKFSRKSIQISLSPTYVLDWLNCSNLWLQISNIIVLHAQCLICAINCIAITILVHLTTKLIKIEICAIHHINWWRTIILCSHYSNCHRRHVVVAWPPSNCILIAPAVD